MSDGLSPHSTWATVIASEAKAASSERKMHRLFGNKHINVRHPSCGLPWPPGWGTLYLTCIPHIVVETLFCSFDLRVKIGDDQSFRPIGPRSYKAPGSLRRN